ncbi:MAG: flagellar export chaperone FliS [Rickettsiales bacterium]
MSQQAGSYKAYNRASHTVNKTRQVVMLYDGAIRFLQQAADAIEKKDFETRYNKLSRASDIIIGLQACLDFDAGGPSAKMLFDFYASIDMRVFTLHRTNDPVVCQAIIAELKEMRDVWDKIDRGGEVPPSEESAKPAQTPMDPMTVSA